MERQQLFNFQKVAQYNNMSKAAKDLHITQPALSKSIAGLEILRQRLLPAQMLQCMPS